MIAYLSASAAARASKSHGALYHTLVYTTRAIRIGKALSGEQQREVEHLAPSYLSQFTSITQAEQEYSGTL